METTNANVLTQEENVSPKTEANTEKDKMTIDLDPIKFEADAETMFINGAQLTEKISAMFKAVFADFVGCQIVTNNPGIAAPEIVNRTIAPGAMYVNLSFAENSSKDGYHVLKRRSETKGTKMISRLNFVNGGMSNRMYTIDDGAKEALEEFLPTQFNKNKKPDFDARYVELVNSAPAGFMNYGFNGGSMTECKLFGFPIELLLKKIYGAKDSEGHDLEYGCNLIRMTVDGRDSVLQVTQLKSSTVNKLFNIMGMGQQQFGNPMLNYMTR